jgi:hypothetical protein
MENESPLVQLESGCTRSAEIPMTSPDSGYAEVHAPNRSRPTRRLLRIRFEAGAWHLSEDGTARIGGIFTSLPAAIAYAQSELRGVTGGGVVHDFDGGAFDRQAQNREREDDGTDQGIRDAPIAWFGRPTAP